MASDQSSRLASIEHAMDFRYFGNQNYPVKLTKATISQTPVAGGKLITFNISAVTDRVILGAELVSDLSFSGDFLDSQKINLAPSCPISVGGFELNFCQILPVDVSPTKFFLWGGVKDQVLNGLVVAGPSFSCALTRHLFDGNYSLKLTMVNQDGRQLTCVAFDYTIPFDSTIEYPEIA